MVYATCGGNFKTVVDKAFGWINKWMEENSDKSEKERQVSNNCGSYCIDQSDTKIIDSVALNELLDNSASLEPLHVDFNTENESVTNLCRKK